MTFEKKLTAAVLLGTLPLLAVTLLCAMMIAAARRDGGGADVTMMTMLCSFAYAFACLVLIPVLGLVIERTCRRKLPLARYPRCLTWLATSTLLLPPVAINGLYYALHG